MRNLRIMFIVLLVAIPTLAFAQSDTSATPAAPTGSSVAVPSAAFQRNGVFGCSLNGAYSMSVGALSAIGGAFVPVSDATVELNTGYLVYKECTLRGIVNRQRENATAGLARQILDEYNRGRNGQPMFSQSIPLESRAVEDKAILSYLNGSQLNGLNPVLQSTIKRAVAQGYMTARNKPNSVYGCSYTNLNSLYSGRPSGSAWSALSAVGTPGCDPLLAYNLANAQALGSAAYSVDNTLTRLGWDNGNYSVMGTDVDGNPIVLTPGSVVGSNALQAIQTGFNQLENANDIDQMVGALFAGITSQVINDNNGLVGLTQSSAGQPSYLDQVVSQSAEGLRNSAINAGLQILAAQQQIETQILNLAQGILNKIKQVSQALRDKENACWTIVIQNVCSSTTLGKDNTCTAKTAPCTIDPATGASTCPTTGATLKVATSTYQYAQQVIDSQITPYQQQQQQIASSSQSALTQIGILISQMTDTSSYSSQLAALQGLDQLIAQGTTLHSPQDVTNEQNAYNTLVGQNGGIGTLDQLVNDTLIAWADSTADPSIGWCNVNQAAVITMWQTRWKQ